MTKFLADETSYSTQDLVDVIREQLEQPYAHSDNLRTAALYCPRAMTSREWVEACTVVGIHAGTARNRLNEVQADRNF